MEKKSERYSFIALFLLKNMITLELHNFNNYFSECARSLVSIIRSVPYDKAFEIQSCRGDGLYNFSSVSLNSIVFNLKNKSSAGSAIAVLKTSQKSFGMIGSDTLYNKLLFGNGYRSYKLKTFVWNRSSVICAKFRNKELKDNNFVLAVL